MSRFGGGRGGGHTRGPISTIFPGRFSFPIRPWVFVTSLLQSGGGGHIIVAICGQGAGEGSEKGKSMVTSLMDSPKYDFFLKIQKHVNILL